MDKLNLYKLMGFEINWTVIKVGIFSHENLPVQLTDDEVLEYALHVIEKGNYTKEELDIASCYEDEKENILKKLCSLSNKENINETTVRKKWTAVLLNEIMKELSNDYVVGLLELTNFWADLNFPNYSPHIIQGKDDATTIPEEYYTEDNYELVKNKHYNWITKIKVLYSNNAFWNKLEKDTMPYVMAEFTIGSKSRRFSPLLVTKVLQVEPDIQYLYEVRTHPCSDGTEVKVIKNSWCIKTEYKKTYVCKDQIKKLLERIKGKEKIIKQICKDYNAEIVICIVPYSYESNFPSMDLDRNLINYFSELNAYYSIDPYLFCDPEKCFEQYYGIEVE